jgi:glycosyltransferase involved in cell wall biosynthesis
MTWITQEAYHQNVRQIILPELQGRVRLRGWMAQSQLISIYDEHGTYLFPSYYEGFAKTFLEAMARGLCVVGTAVDGMRHVIRNLENGFLSTPGDVAGLSRQAVYLLEHWDIAKRVGSAARATARLYTWQSSVEALVGFFEALLHHRSRVQSGGCKAL